MKKQGRVLNGDLTDRMLIRTFWYNVSVKISASKTFNVGKILKKFGGKRGKRYKLEKWK